MNIIDVNLQWRLRAAAPRCRIDHRSPAVDCVLWLLVALAFALPAACAARLYI